MGSCGDSALHGLKGGNTGALLCLQMGRNPLNGFGIFFVLLWFFFFFFFFLLYFLSCFRKEKPVINVHFLDSWDKALDFVLLSPGLA